MNDETQALGQRLPALKADFKKMPSLTIAICASLYTVGLILVTTVGVSVMISTFSAKNALPPQSTPGAAAIQEVRVAPGDIETVTIPLAFDLQQPDMLEVLMRAALSDTSNLSLPLTVHVQTQPPAESVEPPAVEAPPEAPPKKAVKKSKPESFKPAAKSYTGKGVPPKEGDVLRPPKGLSDADRERIRKANRSDPKREKTGAQSERP